MHGPHAAPPPQTQQSKFVNWQVDGEYRGSDFTAAVTLGNPDVLVGSGKRWAGLTGGHEAFIQLPFPNKARDFVSWSLPHFPLRGGRVGRPNTCKAKEGQSGVSCSHESLPQKKNKKQNQKPGAVTPVIPGLGRVKGQGWNLFGEGLCSFFCFVF